MIQKTVKINKDFGKVSTLLASRPSDSTMSVKIIYFENFTKNLEKEIIVGEWPEATGISQQTGLRQRPQGVHT